MHFMEDLTDLLALFAACSEKHFTIVSHGKQNKATLQAHPAL